MRYSLSLTYLIIFPRLNGPIVKNKQTQKQRTEKKKTQIDEEIKKKRYKTIKVNPITFPKK